MKLEGQTTITVKTIYNDIRLEIVFSDGEHRSIDLDSKMAKQVAELILNKLASRN